MKHHDALDLLIFILAILAVVIACLFVTVFIVRAAPSYPMWFVSDQLPGYPTECKQQCTTIPYIDPYIRYYTIWAEKGTITYTRFHFKHVLLSDIILRYGQPDIQLGENWAQWYDVEGIAPGLVDILATGEDGFIRTVEFSLGE